MRSAANPLGRTVGGFHMESLVEVTDKVPAASRVSAISMHVANQRPNGSLPRLTSYVSTGLRANWPLGDPNQTAITPVTYTRSLMERTHVN
jgi:hypothetical protein